MMAEIHKEALHLHKHAIFPQACNFRTFDVISQKTYNLLRQKRKIEISALYPDSGDISEDNCTLIRKKPRF